MTVNDDISLDMLVSLRKFLVPEIVYGKGALELVGRHASNLGGTKILIVTDPGVRKAGWTIRVEECLAGCQLPFVTFDAVTPNPKDHEVMAGEAVYRENGCDLIIALGGGSAMDCAKGIGVMAGNPGHILDYEGVDEIPSPGPPLIFIPTTAGSSADVSQFAIITDTERHLKIAIVSKMVIPDLALIDPKTTTTMSPELTAATGMDALCHAFEAYVSTASSPLTDMAARTAIRLIMNNLEGAYKEPEHMGYRSEMMMASLMAGIAFSNASLGLVHAMAHSLGGAFGLPHGECNAILLEEVVRYNYPSSKEKYDQLLNEITLPNGGMKAKKRSFSIFGGKKAFTKEKLNDPASQLVERLASLRRQVGITQRLNDLGVSIDDLSTLAGYAAKDPCLATNPRDASPWEIKQIYRKIYH